MRIWQWWGLMGLVVVGAPTAVGGDEIRFKDGQVISGTLVDDGETVAIVVPRSAIARVNDQPFEHPQAPAFTAVDVTGATHTVPDPTRRVTLLKFWASWCPFCRSDIPFMNEVVEKYRGRGLQVLAVSVMERDPEQLKTLLQKERLSYPVIATKGDGVPTDQVAIASLYRYQGVPAYFVIDADGAVVKQFSGALSQRKADLEQTLEPLLASSRSTR